MLFWDAFSEKGQLGLEPDPHNSVGALCQQRTIRAGSIRQLHFYVGVALPKPHARLVRMDRSSRQRKDDHRKLLRYTFQGRMGRGAIHSEPSARSRNPNTSVCKRVPRQVLCPAWSRKPPAPIFPRWLRPPASVRQMANSTALRVATTRLAVALEIAPTCGTTKLRPTFYFRHLRDLCAMSSFGYSEDDAGGIRARQLLPEGQAPVSAGGGRWADGPDHARISGLEPVRRRCMAADRVATDKKGHRVCLGAGRVGPKSDRRAHGRTAQHL